jgi:O-antigen ligase
VAVTVISDSRRLHRCCSALLIIGLGVVAMSFTMEKFAGALSDRAEESGPVEIRMAVYRASWEMIREKPLLGWGQNQMPTELAHRMSDYHLDTYWAHNTYLELLMEEGLLGLALYTWIIVALFRLGRVDRHAGDRETLFDSEFRRLWPVMLGVYLVNASFVVMNYQFVNALLFTLAGILAGQKRRATCASDVLAS